jgi:succinyl-diaminopimelate desuccinylase
MYDPERFAEKYQLALQDAVKTKAEGGVSGFELEWNLIDAQFRPLNTVGSGPSKQSFVDYLRSACLSPWMRSHSQLEVFHWMIEWATRPYYHPRGAVYEGRLMEAILLNALHQAGRNFGERLFYWHGNLLTLTHVGGDSIPGSWHLAKRRYLEKCVALYGDTLATAGIHTNLSLPDPLFAWDFMHLANQERGDTHLDGYKSQFYITATRLMRAFAALFVATNASTPLQPQIRNGRPVVMLTEYDSVRNLTFPNPPSLDLPDLYRSYDDYLQISYDLVRRGVRFGNNNWTPVRARSFAEPVERLIAVTSEQLNEIYARGLYSVGELSPVDEMAKQVEMQNLMARINLPMARVEVRTDDGGHPLDVDVANLTFKHLLMARFYADPDFARAFRYDREDIARARRNEDAAARNGLRGEIENPFTGKPVGMRDFLRWALSEVRPLAEALSTWEDLSPLVEMAAGAPNTAERLRLRLKNLLHAPAPHDKDTGEVPLEVLCDLAEEREAQLVRDVETIAETYVSLEGEAGKMSEFFQRARDEVYFDPQVPVRFRPRPKAMLEIAYPDKTSEIVSLAQQLIRIPSITTGSEERLSEVRRAAIFVFDYLRNHGVEVRYFNQYDYPAVLAGFPGNLYAPVLFSGHFDVVPPEPDDSQFDARIEGDYLLGRGSADMKTVAATYLVWLKDRLKRGSPYPPVSLLLVGNEENGETQPMGTPHVLAALHQEADFTPKILIAGERTGERGDELWGEICIENRGVMRFDILARGTRGHSSSSGDQVGLAERILHARSAVQEIANQHLTLSGGSWVSQVRFPFIQVGSPGQYNVTPDVGLLGVEVRSIPQDSLRDLRSSIEAYCQENRLELVVSVMEDGVACDPENPYLSSLVEAVHKVSGREPVIGKKLPGTSARFAPAGQGVVWGQAGIGPHAKNERHFIPSIYPYYRALDAFADLLNNRDSGLPDA